MWHEARKQERKIRVMMVDYKKRADRRRQFYEKIKLDPTQFLRVYGRPTKIHWEPSVALTAEGPQSMMPWQGNADILIDRFDVRAHLDQVPAPAPTSPKMARWEEEEERKCSYERYRILVQNEVAGVSEDQCLKQIYIDELYGALDNKINEEKKKNVDKKAAIGFTYEDSTPAPAKEEPEEVDDFSSEEEEIDLDNTVDIYNLTEEQVQLLNTQSSHYGMDEDDYSKYLDVDKDEAEALRLAKLLEEEKAQFSGRKSRRERRAFKEKRMKDRPLSPPSYAARDSPKYEPFRRSTSKSPSPSPAQAEGHLKFITSFGGDSDEEGVLQGPALPPHLQQQQQQQSAAGSASRSSSSTVKGGSSSSSRRSHRESPERRQNDRPRWRSETSQRPPLFGNGESRYQGSRPYHQGRYRTLSHASSRSRSRSWTRSRSRSRSWGRNRSRRSRSWENRRGRYTTRARSRTRSYSRSRERSRSRTRSRTRSRSLSRPRRSRDSASYSSSDSRSRSKSRSDSGSRSSYSRSRSRSGSKSSRSPSPKVLKSYRRPSLSSNSDLSGSDGDDDNECEEQQQKGGKEGQKGVPELPKLLGKKVGSASKLTPQEKLKRKMQLALNKQHKQDVKARLQKVSKAEQERMDREEELRMIALQMRRREREKRHKEVEDAEKERVEYERWTHRPKPSQTAPPAPAPAAAAAAAAAPAHRTGKYPPAKATPQKRSRSRSGSEQSGSKLRRSRSGSEREGRGQPRERPEDNRNRRGSRWTRSRSRSPAGRRPAIPRLVDY